MASYDSDSDTERLEPREQRTVFDHLRDMKPASLDRLYGKGTILDPAVNGMQGGFEGSRSASQAKKGSANKLLIGYKKVEPGGEAVSWTCRAVLQSLPPLAQHYTLRLLYIDEPPPPTLAAVTSSATKARPSSSSSSSAAAASSPPLAPGAVLLSEVRGWTHGDKESAHEEALTALSILNVVEFRSVEVDATTGATQSTSSSLSSSSGGVNGGGNGGGGGGGGLKRRRLRDSNAVSLNPHFQRGLRVAVSSAQSVPWRDLPSSKALKPDKHATSACEVDRHMHDQWDRVLNYLVQPRSSKKVGEGVKAFLVKAKLIVKYKAEGGDDDDDDDDDGDEDGEYDEQEEQSQRRQRERKASSKQAAASGASSSMGDADNFDEEEDDEEEEEKAEGQEEVEEEDAGPRYVIGPRGYEFLLQDIHVQMWRFAEELISANITSRTTAANNSSKKLFATEVLLPFLFQLGHCKVGQDYPVASLTSEELRLLDHFCAFGFCLRRVRQGDGKAASRFYPSSVACNLVDGFKQQDHHQRRLQQQQQQADPVTSRGIGMAAAAAGSSSSSSTTPLSSSSGAGAAVSRITNLSHFETIVQTNFQVMAYTTKELHLRMLGLFSQLRAILPNAVMAVITRKSMMDAFQDGITAQQIISFLETNAHPRAIARANSSGASGGMGGGASMGGAMSGSASVSSSSSSSVAAGAIDDGRPANGPNSDIVPETVKSQLLLWERERNRISAHRAVLYSFDEATCDFEKFRRMCSALQEEGLLLWSLPGARRLAVKASPPRDEEKTMDQAAIAIMERA